MALDIVLDQFEGAYGGSMGGGSITTKKGLSISLRRLQD